MKKNNNIFWSIKREKFEIIIEKIIMKGPGFPKKLSLRNLNNIQINEPIDKNSEESNDLIHITTPSNISKIKYLLSSKKS